MNESLNRIIATLGLVEVRGRQNLSLLLQATLILESGENLAEAAKCLDALTVNGKGNIDMVLGCIMAIEQIIKPKESDEQEEKTDA